MINTPQAKIIVYNYIDRTGSAGGLLGAPDVSNDVELINLDKEIISISTSKHKSNPSGSFEIVLAPTKNWLTALSPGSWLSIHMSPTGITSGKEYSESTLKMIGRIDSVRISVSVDQTSGARQTTFTIVGRDWGQVFESSIYIDQAAKTGADDAISQQTRAVVDFKLPNIFLKGLPSTTDIVTFIIDFWGRKSPSLAASVAELSAERFTPNFNFVLPGKLVSNLQQKDSLSDSLKNPSSLINSIAKSSNLADLMGVVPGKLTGYDTYKDSGESWGPLDPSIFVGNHSLWQMINSHSCDIVNELIAELRWESGSPKFSLYKRIKPFSLKSTGSILSSIISGGLPLNTGTGTEKITSSFFNVKRTFIPKDNILALDAGNSWGERINFIEILPNADWATGAVSALSGAAAIPTKQNAAILDVKSFAREGLKPMIRDTVFLPIIDATKTLDLFGLTQWLPVLRGWYFDTHKMLNGSISFMGVSKYIGVGDNIIIDSNALGDFPMVAPQVSGAKDAKMIAHVESITHAFKVFEGGARNFITTVNFVRGVITNDKGTALLDPNSFGIDTDASKIPPNKEDIGNTY